jgi:hypothetical protein
MRVSGVRVERWGDEVGPGTGRSGIMPGLLRLCKHCAPREESRLRTGLMPMYGSHYHPRNGRWSSAGDRRQGNPAPTIQTAARPDPPGYG